MMEPAILRDRALRILHIIVSVGPSNAQYNEHCLPLARKRNITICSFFKAALTTPPEIAFFEGNGTLKGFWRSLRAAIDAGPYDVVHVHAPQTGACMILWSLLSRRSLSNAVCTVHNSFQNYDLRDRFLWFIVFAFFPRIVLCSHAALASLPAILRLLGGKRVSVVQNGVDTERVGRVLASTTIRRTNGPFTVISVGRLINMKNPMTLLQAFSESDEPQSKLVYVGDGPLRPRLIEEATRLGLNSRVSFTGLIGRDEVYRQIVEADILVSTSRGEGLPIAVLEAMACGRPLILSDIEPHREIVGGLDLVTLIQPDDVNAFAREIRRMMHMPDEDRMAVGGRCRVVVEHDFSLKAMHRSYAAVYAGMICRNREKRPAE